MMFRPSASNSTLSLLVVERLEYGTTTYGNNDHQERKGFLLVLSVLYQNTVHTISTSLESTPLFTRCFLRSQDTSSHSSTIPTPKCQP
jgi:hypothetical protein